MGVEGGELPEAGEWEYCLIGRVEFNLHDENIVTTV